MPDGSLLLTRHADCVAVYKDTHTFSSDKRAEYAPKYGAGSPLYEHHTTSLVFNDPPLHTRVRRLIAGALTPKAIESLEDGLVHLVNGLLDRMEERQRAGGEVDLIEDFAAAIPVEIIGNLLGVPHDERAPLRGWSLAILGALEPRLTDGAEGRRQPRRDRDGRLPAHAGRRAAAASRRSGARRAHAADPGRGGRRRQADARTSSARTASSSSTPATRPPPT